MAPQVLVQRLLQLPADPTTDDHDVGSRWEVSSSFHGCCLYRRAHGKRTIRHRLFGRTSTDSDFRISGECLGTAHDVVDALASIHRLEFMALVAFATSHKVKTTAVESHVTVAGCRRVRFACASTTGSSGHDREIGNDWFIHTGTAPVATAAVPTQYVIFQPAVDAETPQWFGVLLRQHAPGHVHVDGAGSLDGFASRGPSLLRTLMRLFQFGEAVRLRLALLENRPSVPVVTQPVALRRCTICHIPGATDRWRPRWWRRALESCDVCHTPVCHSCWVTKRVVDVKSDCLSRPFVRVKCCKTCLVAFHSRTLRAPQPVPRVSLHTASSWNARALLATHERLSVSTAVSLTPSKSWSLRTPHNHGDLQELWSDHDYRSTTSTESTAATDSLSSFHQQVAVLPHSVNCGVDRSDDRGEPIAMLEDTLDELTLADLTDHAGSRGGPTSRC